VSQHTLDPIHNPSKVNWISHASTLSAEVHHGDVGEEKERGGLGERNRVIHVQPPTLVHLSGNEILSGLETVVGTVYPWCYSLVSDLCQSHSSTTFKLMNKAQAHNRAEMYLKMFRSKYRIKEKNRRTLPPNTQRDKCVYLTPVSSALFAISAVRARTCTKRRDPSRRVGGEDGTKRERKRERSSEKEVNT